MTLVLMVVLMLASVLGALLPLLGPLGLRAFRRSPLLVLGALGLCGVVAALARAGRRSRGPVLVALWRRRVGLRPSRGSATVLMGRAVLVTTFGLRASASRPRSSRQAGADSGSAAISTAATGGRAGPVVWSDAGDPALNAAGTWGPAQEASSKRTVPTETVFGMESLRCEFAATTPRRHPLRSAFFLFGDAAAPVALQTLGRRSSALGAALV